MCRESEARALRTITSNTSVVESKQTMEEAEKIMQEENLGTLKSKEIDSEKEISSNDSSSSGSDNDMMNIEGLLAVKDIEKLTGGHLDIKPMDVDLGIMKPLVHTPKSGIKLPLDAINMSSALDDKGFLLFSPM